MTIQLKVIGCYGGRVGNKYSPTYLLTNEKTLALDAGSICTLEKPEQEKIDDIIITDSHKDHWADLPYFAYNKNRWKQTAKVHGLQQTLDTVKNHTLKGMACN